MARATRVCCERGKGPLKHPSQPQVLLFDLGGVLIEVDFQRAFRAWQPLSAFSFPEICERFAFDDEYARHERGEIGAGEYFEHICRKLSLRREYGLVETGWNSIYVGDIPETVAMVSAARALIPCYAFTNTNATHQIAWTAQFPQITKLFDKVFSSHEIGSRKPERAAFEHIARVLDVPLNSILFFDDLPENVEGAKAADLQAVLVRSPGDVRAKLEEIGVGLS